MSTEQYGGSAQEVANSRSLQTFLESAVGKQLVVEQGKGVVTLRLINDPTCSSVAEEKGL